MEFPQDIIKMISIPTPYDVGAVNLYLILDEPITLIDAGPYSVEAEEGFLKGLSELNLAPEAIKRIVITHAHPDHVGMAGRLQELTGATVLMSTNDVTKLSKPTSDGIERHLILDQAGMPEEIIQKMTAASAESGKRYNTKLNFDKVESLEDGQKLIFNSLELEVLYTPGHSIGHLSLYHEPSGILFAGDNLLEGISPNPVLELNLEGNKRYKGMPNYLASLDLMSKLKINQVYPAHGKPFSHHMAVIQRFFSHFHKREEKVLKMVDTSEKTAYQLASLVHPTVRGLDLFLAVSLTIGHLDLLVDEGRVTEQEKDGKIYYSLARKCFQ